MFSVSLLWKLPLLCSINAIFCIQQIHSSDSSEFNQPANIMRPVSFLPIRNAIYPGSNVTRFNVPDNLVNWMVKYADYLPEFYESPSIHGKPWADPPIDDVNFQPKWHTVDGDIDRRSFHGEYEIRDNYPLNVAGRTGIVGRGLLGRWAVNHAADPVVTRWKRNTDGTIEKHTTTGKNIIEMIVIQRRDNLQWAIPGGMVDAGEKATATLKREFMEEALNSNNAMSIEKFFDEKGVEIYSGYVDDRRNTDNAWIETTAYNFHDDTGETLKLKLQAGDDAGSVKWLSVDQNVELYGSHKDIVQKCVERLNAHW